MSPKTKEAYFLLGHYEVRVEESVEYLGIVLDKGMIFAAEIQRASEKPKKTTRAFTVFLPNTSDLVPIGASYTRREVLEKEKIGTGGKPSYPMSNGHGCFMTYLEKIGQRAEGKCVYCDEIDQGSSNI
ncbi:hypothetical protein Zmor_002256 [Zophobas morio]|uniref:Uncharacterized protein n=1 Tax=Zophobas morio TaxID=2755281 RepID=A0AA38J4F9_9CUCU|nr:hypothetical protein Zmor_002256 [Zophobas morio]